MELWEPKRSVQRLSQTLPNSCSPVTGPQVSREVICDQALDQMIFHRISIHVGSLHMIKKNTMVSRFFVKLTFKRWFLKITQKTWNMIHLMACRNPCRLYVHCAFTYFVGPSSVMWSELGLAPPFPPMRVLEVQWSHALGLMCEVALGCPNHGIWPTHIGCVCVEGETVSKELLLRSNLIGLWSDF